MRTCLLILFSGLFQPAMPQVKSKSFQLLLNIILSDKTPVINVKEAAANKNSYTFLDAREAREYTVSHIPEARFVGSNQFELSAISDLPKNTPIIIYCSVGKRSEKITNKLLKEGYRNVHNLYGGIFEWVNEGNCVVDKENKSTNKVHAYGRFWGQWLEKGEKVY
ncbi:MAG: rhodanese-like domain-containing protein [Flavitalea sp.]